jgi:hypothetical protein
LTLSRFLVSCAAGSKGDPRISCAKTCLLFATAKPTGERHEFVKHAGACETDDFTVELRIHRLANVDVGGLDGDESYEPSPLLQVSLGTQSAKHPRVRRRGHTVLIGAIVEENNHVSVSSFEASRGLSLRLPPFSCKRSAGSGFILRQVRPEKTDWTRTRDTTEPDQNAAKLFSSESAALQQHFSSFTFVHVQYCTFNKVRQHVVPIAYQPPVMDEILSNVHETLQDSLDIVRTRCSLNTLRAHLHTARISTFIHQGTLASIGKFGASNYPSIWKPRELPNTTGIPCAPKYL